MVEGPGATRNARKAQAAVGGVVQYVQGAQQLVLKKKYEGCQLIQVFSVGKEVFLIFCKHDKSDEIALRLHFGMNGCLWLRNANAASRLPAWRQSEGYSLRICFQLNTATPKAELVLETVSSTTSETSGRVARAKLERLAKQDVCGSSFEAEAVLRVLHSQRASALISDALLDQERFPGVGNIIKIEGLHLARVHPQRLVSGLCRQELLTVIQHCREYALSWLRTGRAPHKRVYNKTRCETCQGQHVQMVKLGHGLRRVTFWCKKCQPLDPKNALIGTQKNTTLEEREICMARKEESGGDKPQQHHCRQHGAASLCLKRVRKTNANHLRLFWCCTKKGCSFFSWADEGFPYCRCPTRCRLYVSKTQATGGRWFFACPNRRCDYFIWATPQKLAPIQSFLTPLL